MSDQTIQATPQANQGATPNNLAVQGDNNVAIGTNAGQGNGTSFSDTVAIGTNASATASGAVAIGAGSVANEANTVSVGSPGAERRITNVAPGVNATDAATYGQLTTAIGQTQQAINQVGSIANKGVAMSMAQSAAGLRAGNPGEMSLSMASGYYEGEAAVGVGLTGSSKDGERAFHVASSLAPGLSDVGIQASYAMRVGKASPKETHETSTTPGIAEIPMNEWYKHGCTEVRIITPVAFIKRTMDRVSSASKLNKSIRHKVMHGMYPSTKRCVMEPG